MSGGKPMNFLKTVFHLVGAVQFWYAIYYDYSYVHIPQDLRDAGTFKRDTFGGKFKYLTFINGIIQALYFTIALLNDLIGTNEVSPKKTPLIRKIKDYGLATFAWPVAWNVAITFWGLYAVDRELVFPRVLDTFFPNWLNHVLHTNIAIFIMLEMCVSFRRYPSRQAGLFGLGLFMLAYLVWIHIIYNVSGVWVYPVFEVLNLPQRVLFFAASLVFSVILYLSGEFVNKIIWVKELKPIKGRKSN
jgi:hypothetical protein